ncbi:hypothetical protein AAC387_Pa02g2426 [Persea americana]
MLKKWGLQLDISTNVPTIESLYEDEEFDQRQLAALVVSKVIVGLFSVFLIGNMIQTHYSGFRLRVIQLCYGLLWKLFRLQD